MAGAVEFPFDTSEIRLIRPLANHPEIDIFARSVTIAFGERFSEINAIKLAM
jgi:hypothetical protein